MDVLYFTVVLLGAAVVSVILCQRNGFGSVLGYLLAGMVVGPYGLAIVTDVTSIFHLSELGVVLLLFLIGLELQPRRLWAMSRLVLGGGLSQLLLTIPMLFAGLCLLSNWSWQICLFAAACASLSSTAFALQLLEEQHELQTPHGKLGFAILLLQDLAAIPALAILPLFAAEQSTAGSNWLELLLPIGLMVAGLLAAPTLLAMLFNWVAAQKNQELFTAATLGIVALGAFVMAKVGLSQALGAFVAGMLLADSKFRHELEANIQPFKGLLLGLFFMAVGMSMKLPIMLGNLGQIAAMTTWILLGKMAVLALIARSFALTKPQILTLALSLCQGGEFAFVLLGSASQLQLIPQAIADLFVGTITLSMLLNALLFAFAIKWLRPKLQQTAAPEAFQVNPEQDNPVIVAGFGRVGQIVGRLLHAKKIPFTALDKSSTHIAFVEAFGSKVFYGDASRLDLLRAARAEHAKVFVLCIDEPQDSIRTAEQVLRHFPHLKIIARVRNRAHAYRLMALGIDVVIRETLSGSLEMGSKVLQAMGMSPVEAQAASTRFRQHDEDLLRRSFSHQDDMPTLIAISQQGRAELESLFAQDQTTDPTAN